MVATVQIDLPLSVSIGTYGPNDVAATNHRLRLELRIEDRLALPSADAMEHVFDYDPVRDEVLRLAAERPYETQEFLLSRIVRFCALLPKVVAIDAKLTKSPVCSSGGEISVRVRLGRKKIKAIRDAAE